MFSSGSCVNTEIGYYAKNDLPEVCTVHSSSSAQ